MIKKDTVIETPDGKTTEAGSVTGIWISFPPIPPIPPKRDDDDTNDDFSPIPPKRDDDDGNNAPFSFVGWLCDFRFKQSYVMKILRLLAIIFYIIEVTSILFAGICLCFATFSAAMYGLSHNEASALLLLLVLPPILIGIVLFIVLARLSCEYFLFFMDWLVTTKKAADKYNAE